MTDDLNLADLGRNPNSVTLKDATYEEIWQELSGRFVACVFLRLADVGDDQQAHDGSFHGGRYACAGMAQAFINQVLND